MSEQDGENRRGSASALTSSWHGLIRPRGPATVTRAGLVAHNSTVVSRAQYCTHAGRGQGKMSRSGDDERSL